MISNKHFLYLGLVRRSVYKIGISANVRSRVKELGVTLLREWRLPFEAHEAETIAKALLCNAGYRSRFHSSSREYFICHRHHVDAAIEAGIAIAAGSEPQHVAAAIRRIEHRRAVRDQRDDACRHREGRPTGRHQRAEATS